MRDTVRASVDRSSWWGDGRRLVTSTSVRYVAERLLLFAAVSVLWTLVVLSALQTFQ